MAPPNKDLSGHQLLLVLPWDIPSTIAEGLKARYPGLEVEFRVFNSWVTRVLPPAEIVSDETWRKTTIFLAGPVVPTPEQAPNMQLVQLMSAGSNHMFNTPLFQRDEVVWCSANGVHGPQISEWVICTFLAHRHNIPKYLKHQAEGKWAQSFELNTRDAANQRVGILGYGSIGRHVARVASAMGMEVYAYTNSPRPTPDSRRDRAYHVPGMGDPDGTLPTRWFSGNKPAEVAEFLASGLDLLVVCAPLTPETQGLLGREQLKLLAGRRTFVSNIARGGLIVTDALIEALDEGWISGAALDVTDPEPLPEGHPLWFKENVIVTPHISASSTSYTERLMAILEVNLERLSKGEEFLNRVDSKRGY